MQYDELRGIFTGLFHGNRNAAEVMSENIPHENTCCLSESDRIKQDRINYNYAILKKYYNRITI